MIKLSLTSNSIKASLILKYYIGQRNIYFAMKQAKEWWLTADAHS